MIKDCIFSGKIFGINAKIGRICAVNNLESKITNCTSNCQTKGGKITGIYFGINDAGATVQYNSAISGSIIGEFTQLIGLQL